MTKQRTGVSLWSQHYAHICIMRKDNRFPELDVLNDIAKQIVDELGDGVSVDPDFCCNVLSEISLIGPNEAKVRAAANELADWVENSQDWRLL